MADPKTAGNDQAWGNRWDGHPAAKLWREALGVNAGLNWHVPSAEKQHRSEVGKGSCYQCAISGADKTKIVKRGRI